MIIESSCCNKLTRLAVAMLVGALTGCAPSFGGSPRIAERIVPSTEFSRAVSEGREREFSILNRRDEILKKGDAPAGDELAAASRTDALMNGDLGVARAKLGTEPGIVPVGFKNEAGEGALPLRALPASEKLPQDGFKRMASIEPPSETIQLDNTAARMPVAATQPPPGSSAPYYMGQMTPNPSLWSDEGMGMYRDLRAYQPMDIVTITINENNDGQKQSRTDARSKFSIVAAIENLFGKEQRWVTNNEGLDKANLINASTESSYEGNGQARRQGTLRAQMSAVILEVLPNGILRIEGTKIVSVDNEEEVMVISGLVRVRDINATNQVDSNRIANMRIDFYGRGVLADTTSPGWGVRIFRAVWPF